MSNASITQTNRIVAFGPYAFAIALLTFAAFAACNRSSSKPTSAIADKSTSAAVSTAAPTPKSVDLEKPVVQIETSEGSITIRLDGTRAPVTVGNFLNYVYDGFYENTLVHYVDAGKMIVAGGYLTDRKAQARTYSHS